MHQYNIAIVGATGLVGNKMLEVLERKRFPINKLVPIASSTSAGQTISFRNETFLVQELSEAVFSGVDIALFSAGASISKEFAPIAVQKGAVVIDNSSAWRMEPDIPLIIPEVNPTALKGHQGIIANPNCSTIQMVVAVYPLHQHFKIRRIVVSTYQAVSGSGKLAVQQLKEEIEFSSSTAGAYPHPIAYNCLPHIDVFYDDGYTKEEYKMIYETQKIIDDANIQVSPTCVRVPVLGGHSESINLEFETPFELDQVRSLLETAPGIVIRDNPADHIYPMPIDAEGLDAVFVGRIRRDSSLPNGLNLWVVSDNLYKGAATNAVQIAESLINQKLL